MFRDSISEWNHCAGHKVELCNADSVSAMQYCNLDMTVNYGVSRLSSRAGAQSSSSPLLFWEFVDASSFGLVSFVVGFFQLDIRWLQVLVRLGIF